MPDDILHMIVVTYSRMYCVCGFEYRTKKNGGSPLSWAFLHARSRGRDNAVIRDKRKTPNIITTYKDGKITTTNMET